MSKGICTECGSGENYNFEINCGLCSPCIEKKLALLTPKPACKDSGFLTDAQLQSISKDIESGLITLVETKHYHDLEASERENDRLKEQLREGMKCTSYGMCEDAHEAYEQQIQSLQSENERLRGACKAFRKLYSESDMRPEDECSELYDIIDEALKESSNDKR